MLVARHDFSKTAMTSRRLSVLSGEPDTLDEATAVAVKRVITWQIEQEMKAQNLNKTKMAKKMRPSRAALNRLLDENDTSLTLTTLASAATVLGKTLKVGLAVA